MVNFTTANGHGFTTVTTDENGRFTLPHSPYTPPIPSEELRLAVKVPGYWTVHQTVSREENETEVHTTIKVKVRDTAP